MSNYIKSNFNYFTFSFFKKYYFSIIKKENSLKRLNYIEKTCKFASQYFPLLLADIKIEEELISISKKEFKQWNNKLSHNQNSSFISKNILHIATQIYDIGGHTRVINNWIEKENKRNSFFILTNQQQNLKTKILTKIQDKTKCTNILDPKLNHIEKCNLILNFIIEHKIDTVVLHTHPYDVIPLLICSIPNFPYTILFNHSDHTFVLGTLSSDLYLDITKEGQKYTHKYRMVRNSKVINLPTNISPRIKETQYDKKITLISMASSWKFKPFENFNFFSTYIPFLNKHKNITLKIIGIDPKDFKQFTKLKKPENLEILGIVPEPENIISQADYFIEMFPSGSYLSTLDSCSYGLIPIFYHDQITLTAFGVKQTLSLTEPPKPYNTNDEYLAFIDEEFKYGKFKQSNKEKVYNFLNDKCYNNWYKSIDSILNNLYERNIYLQTTIPKNKKVETKKAKRYARFTLSANHFYWSDFVNFNKLIKKPQLLSQFLYLYLLTKYIQYTK